MITPSFGLTATERVLPRLALDLTTASLDARVTFTRTGDTATVVNSSGVIVGINANLPRFDYDPTTLVCKGLLIEEERTNLLLNSLIDGTNLATQSVTVTAAAHTLSFYGTGIVALTGAHTATVNGLGAYPTRTTLTFTPTAGSLTLTVTGDVKFANLTLGVFPTSFIPTAGVAVTRNVDRPTMTGTNFTDWFNASEGTLFVEGQTSWSATPASSAFRTLARIYSADGNSSISNVYQFDGAGTSVVRDAGVTQASMVSGTLTSNVVKQAIAYKANDFAFVRNAGTVQTDVSGTVPANLTVMNIGTTRDFSALGTLNGHIRKIYFYPQRLTNAEVQAITK